MSVNIKEAAEKLGVSRKVVYRLIGEGRLRVSSHPLYKRGGPQHIPDEDVEAVLRSVQTIAEDRAPYQA